MAQHPGAGRRAALAALAGATLVVVLLLLDVRCGTSGAPSVDGARTDDQLHGDPEQGSGQPTPSGEDAAVSTALSFTSAAQRWLYLDDGEVHAEVVAATTPAASSRLAATVLEGLDAARRRLVDSPGRVWWVVRPLASKVEMFDPPLATVSVWVVTVLSATEVAAPQSEWVTTTIQLTLVDGTWLVADSRDSHGPTPLSGAEDQPWDANEFDSALDGFVRLDTGADS